MKELKDIGNEELLEFLKNQSVKQLNIYCDQYMIRKQGNKDDKVHRIHKRFMNELVIKK